MLFWNLFFEIRNKMIIILLLVSGIRNTELCDIKMEDISETFIKIYGKGKKGRYDPKTFYISKMLI